MESLEIFVQKAQVLGLCLCLENMIPRTQWLVNPEEFVDVLDQFPTLKLLLDIGHAHINDPKGKKCLRFIEMFSGRVGHLHVSDHFGKEDQHLPIGEGVINFSKIAAALKAIGYDDTITLEVFTGDRDDLKVSKMKMEATFRKS
jgi:sugar phosphate isomerase/epimerase